MKEALFKHKTDVTSVLLDHIIGFVKILLN